ncbi:Protein of unknown function DUF1800 [Pedosphaera parvula Ellin514]|uniref:DUF1800 family protein n=2 Tax=Pedosphaera TaxID=1032526 RepID=B9XJG2_PEDPL|nr:Protein of unknown function DUF1800 [Pedosphaera parvula Ellin514]
MLIAGHGSSQLRSSLPMRSKRLYAGLLLACMAIFPQMRLLSQTAPILTNVLATSNQVNLSFDPYPAAQSYTFLSTTNLSSGFTTNTNFFVAGYNFATNKLVYGAITVTNVTASYAWRLTNAPTNGFFKLLVTPMSSNAVLASIVLNRLAYGPTPDELDRVLNATNGITPQGYINEQLAPWAITETVDSVPALQNIAIKFVEATTPIYTNNASTNASLNDLRAWHVLRAVGAKRQLLEILLQFWENHFVTQYTKSVNYFDGTGLDSTTAARVATEFEYLENEKWRNALLNPQCTFYDLLRISAESPAMIIYLDTVISKGDHNNVANENYARELMELFTMGVNNGYDQTDITILSRCWTGWFVQKVDPTNTFNPLVPKASGNVNTNLGVCAFNYQTNTHNITAKTIFPAKTVPARFGAPWAGRNYQLNIPAAANYTDTNGIQEGYMVINHLANQPFTEEFISVKLCNLFVHDGFAIGYDFTDPNLSPEGQLVKSCMLTWENSSPKGQIWMVLSNIFNSDLFRGNAAAMQKVKTPLEYTVSAIRAMRVSTNGTGNPGTFASDTDGYSISGAGSAYPLVRMGNLLLFDRQDPNGYPEDAGGWISAGTLAERIRWIQTFCMASNDSSKNDSISSGNKSTSDPVGLLKYKLALQSPPGSITNEANVADYLLSIFYPGEGAGNLALYRQATINFLKTADDGVTTSPLSGLSQTGNPSLYETRIRGAVSMLLSLQRFQEQ